MKNQSIKIEATQIMSLSSSNQMEVQEEKVKVCCPYNKLSNLICMNQNCTQNAFICSDTKCNCRKQHIKCIKTDTQSIFINVKSRIVSVDKLQKLIDNKIQKIIDFLSDSCNIIIKKLKEQFDHFGLNESEIQFLNEVNNGNLGKITGQKIWDIIHSQQKTQNIKIIVHSSSKAIQDNFKKSQQYLEKSLKQVKREIQSCAFEGKSLSDNDDIFNYFKKKNPSITKEIVPFFQSQILTSLSQFKSIEGFFAPRKLTSAQLLYRASEYDFEVKKFHQRCNHVANTLVLVKTEFGKIIGGYTPIPWKSNGRYEKDVEFKTFIFSLTYGDKFKLINRDKALFFDDNYGPIFGDRGDLLISDKANTNKQSRANINRNFQNEKYLENDKESQKRFTGNGDQNGFKIIQWQVWSLQVY